MTRMSTLGENGLIPLEQGLLPNDGVSMYGENKTKFRIRMLTAVGVFSPDGIFGLHPADYRKHFRLVGIEEEGTRVPRTEQGKTYLIDGYDQCYREDSDNQIASFLSGREKAAERIKILEIPAQGDVPVASRTVIGGRSLCTIHRRPSRFATYVLEHRSDPYLK